MPPSDRNRPRRNALAGEKSPYLLQHSTNPVDWFPWGDQAFEQARREDKPVFLSIGYSTCHWCHVMAEESFEDPEVAALMNDAFVSIKVDREERPDIDHIYITVCQMMTGSAGWPLTIIMTPDAKPFFAATYVPRENRFGRIGMLELVPRVRELWSNHRSQAVDTADKISLLLARQIGEPGTDLGAAPAGVAASPGSLDSAILEQTYRALAAKFDPENGGFGGAPKFPTPQNLFFLLRYWQRTGEHRALAMVTQTLDMMRMGGIYDHIGFGFHRYSTDERWRVPHFEKMLYDQALVAAAYTEAFQATGEARYRLTAEEIIAYVLRDMTSPEGGFYSAEDADSEGGEGKFYLWTAAEVREALGEIDANIAGRAFNITAGGAVGEPHAGLPPGSNILHVTRSPEDLSADLGLSQPQLRERLESARQMLFAVRRRRVPPHKDDKVLADWNGLAIGALAKAAQAFDQPRYASAARRAADFVLGVMRSRGGRLLHRWRDGEAAIAGTLNDYVFMVWGLTELYEATFEAAYLRAALDLNGIMMEHFWDSAGGLYFTSDDGERLLVRMKETYDGALPSGNSVAMLNLVRLARLTGDRRLEEQATALASWLARQVREVPLAHVYFVAAIDFVLGPSYEVVVVGSPAAEDTEAMLRALRSRFVPNAVVLFRPDGPSPEITSLAAFTRDLKGLAGKATAYVCRGFTCQMPTADITKMLEHLAQRP